MNGWALAATALAAVAAALPWRSRSTHPRAPVGEDAVTQQPAQETVEGLVRFRAPLALVTGLGAAVLVGGWVGGGIGAASAVTVWLVLSRMEPPAARRRREAMVAALPHAVDLMAASLAVGASPAAALELVTDSVDPPLSEELRLVARRLGLGMDPVRVWTDLAAHMELGPLGRCLTRAAETGAPVSDAMLRLGEDLRRTARADVEGRARRVGVKAAAPLGLCLLPAFVLVGIVPLVVGALGAVVWF